MEMRLTVHGKSPLRVHDTDGRKMIFDCRGRHTRMKSGVVDEERLILYGSIGYEVESGNLMGGYAKIFKRNKRRFGCSHHDKDIMKNVKYRRKYESIRLEGLQVLASKRRLSGAMNYIISNLEMPPKGYQVSKNNNFPYSREPSANAMDNAILNPLCTWKQPKVTSEKAGHRAATASSASSRSNPLYKSKSSSATTLASKHV